MLKAQFLYDMSEYPPEHPVFGKFHDSTNKKVLGKFKDEFAGAVITHVVCPRPKMYTVRSLKIKKCGEEFLKDAFGKWVMEESCGKKVKGVSRTAVKNQIHFGDFLSVLNSSIETTVTMTGFRSYEHRIFTETVTKKALNGLDTKRFAVDNIKTLAFGHKDIV